MAKAITSSVLPNFWIGLSVTIMAFRAARSDPPPSIAPTLAAYLWHDGQMEADVQALTDAIARHGLGMTAEIRLTRGMGRSHRDAAQSRARGDVCAGTGSIGAYRSDGILTTSKGGIQIYGVHGSPVFKFSTLDHNPTKRLPCQCCCDI